MSWIGLFLLLVCLIYFYDLLLAKLFTTIVLHFSSLSDLKLHRFILTRHGAIWEKMEFHSKNGVGKCNRIILSFQNLSWIWKGIPAIRIDMEHVEWKTSLSNNNVNEMKMKKGNEMISVMQYVEMNIEECTCTFLNSMMKMKNVNMVPSKQNPLSLMMTATCIDMHADTLDFLSMKKKDYVPEDACTQTEYNLVFERKNGEVE